MTVVTENILRQQTFKEIYNLIDTNKPIGWTVLASYPEIKPVFPVIIVNPVTDNAALLDLCGEQREHILDILIDIYTLSKEGKSQVDEGRDNIFATFLANQSILRTGSGLILLGLDDSNVDSVTLNDQKLNLATVAVRFRLQN